jgi:hypothetical protein
MRWQYDRPLVAERISYLTEEERGDTLAPAISGYSSLIPTPFRCTLITHRQEHSRKVSKKG